MTHNAIPTPQTFEKFARLLQAANEQEGVYADILWGPDLQLIEVPLDGKGVTLNESDLVVSAQELTDALILVRKNREVRKNESNTSVG